MTTLRIELPWPEPELSPNHRAHPLTKARAARQAKADGYLAAKQALEGRAYVAPTFKLPLRLTFCPPSDRKRDADNLVASEKSYLDGIAQALDVNDTRFELTPVRGEILKPRGAVFVEIGP